MFIAAYNTLSVCYAVSLRPCLCVPVSLCPSITCASPIAASRLTQYIGRFSYSCSAHVMSPLHLSASLSTCPVGGAFLEQAVVTQP